MKKMFKGCLTTIGAVVVIGIIIGIFASGGEEETASNETTAEEPKQEENAQKEEKKEEPKEEKKEEVKAVGIGEKATVADVGFTVTNVKTASEIDSGNQFVDNATTSGKFVILDVKIDNGKKEALTINSSFFKIKTKDGTTYEPTTSGQVMMAMGDDMGDFFLTQINPGLSKSGKVVFEVPTNVKLSETVLQAQTGFFGTESIKINLK